MAGIALTALKEYEQAFREFLTAYKCAVAVNQTKFAGLFSEMAKLFSKPSERSNDMITHTTQNILGHGHDWAEACYLLAEHNEWDSAKIAYTQFAKSGGPPVMPLNVSLKPFCSIKHIKSNPWVADMMLYLLQCGSDRHTISLEEGDTYLHAVVRISLIANKPNFLKHLVQNYCKKADLDQNKLDSNGNTLIHIAKKEKKVNRKVRKNVTEFLHGCGVDRHVQNNEKKQAGSYLSDEQRNKALIDNMPTKGGIQALHYNQRETKNQRSGTNAVGHERKHRTRTCENCEKLYLNAVEKLSADKTDGIKLLVDLLNMDHANKCHSIIEKAVDDLSKYIGEINQEDVAICLNSLRKEKYFTIIDSLVNHKRWALLDLTIQVYKKRSFALRELKAFAIKFSVEPLILDTSLASEDELRVACCLLDSGWRIGDDNGRMAVKNAVELQKFKLVIELIKRGADISWMSIYNGDTPIHAAICIALKEKQLTFIQELLHIQEEEKDKYLYLDPEQVDANGDCIYHLLAKADYDDFVLRLTEMLCSKIISANYCNKERKYPSDYVKKTHPRLLKFLEDASKIKPSREQVIYKELENDAKSKSSEVETELAQEIKSKHPPQSLTEQTEATRKHIEALISSLPANVVVKSADRHTHEIEKINKDITLTSRKTSVDQTITKPKVVGMTENKHKSQHKNKARGENENSKTAKDERSCLQETEHVQKRKGERIKTLDDIADKMSFAPKNVEENYLVAISEAPDLENDDMSGPPPLESDEVVDGGTQQIRVLNVSLPVNTQIIEKKEDDQDEIADADEDLDLENSFENLTWEVEYTDKVRKTLEDKQVMSKLKCKIVRIIRMLASGDWQRHLCKELTNVPPTLRLFEAKLSKGRRIIWEKAISFSSRCSDTADHRLKFSAEDDASQVRGGRIYTELIRVWDIVMDHDKIKRSVDRIKLSHQRGESCIIRRKLKGLKKENDQRIRATDIAYPLLFTENGPKDDPGHQEEVQHFPPASANETEYHILKFYPWDTTLVKHILQSSNVKVDFPFKVTDLEHAIINLSGKEAILLLGRSGTGKTTCCLYRLWSQFRLYWYNRSIDAPLLPGSERTQVHENNDTSELEETAEESNQTTCEGNIENESHSCERNTKNENTKHVNEENCVEDSETYEHFHQIFVTKNHVLAAEVRKTFNEFMKADENLSKHQSENIDQALPNRLQDLQENAYPLFLTSRQLLCKLDASVGNSFFERNDDGSLKYHVDGWADTDEEITDLHFLDYDSADEDTGIVDGTVNDNDDDIGVNRSRKDDTDVRREVTYDIFENEMWPKLESKTNADYHPSLVWTEIMSFIKGSYESLAKPNGCLSKDEYIDLGRKRAPNFSGEREEIYDIFVLYEHKKKQSRMFDETDVVRSVFQRLAQLETSPVAIHQIYVDETQDFTQAELFLLIRLCQNPNDMFLTGDTAQGIMRGISFRFKDLRSLFYHVKQMTEEAKKTSKASKSVTVHVPNEVHQLTYNYRSHSGILYLASSILEILSHFFPESFDRLDPDQGLFHGPEPILLESCSFSDLAVLLRGNKRKTSNIEFGAHQVILVVNDEARDCLPEELSCGLVLTIYESKGLEFDDVLLYNFFKDSQASKEWRVVTKHLKELASKDTIRSSRQTEMCVKIDQDVLSSKGRPRPLDFDPNQHKILNYELKQLYTALTRARVNVWIFDEDLDKRGPMFEYFKARNLVKPVNVTELNEESLSKTIFVEESSNHDWIQRGDYFMKNRLYGVAAKCFRRGGDQKKQVLAEAHDKALMASRKKDKTKEIKDMRVEFLFAAEMYLNCQHLPEAAKCLSNAKEAKLAAALYKKLGEYDKAAELCKKNRQFVECSRLYELSEKFNKAVSILYENGIYDLALDVVKRYKMREMEMEKNGNPLLDQLRANKPDALYTEEKISLRAAEEFHRRGNTNSMHEAVSRFQYEDDKIEFYKRTGYIYDAANKLAIAGRFPEATHLYIMSGNLKDARCMAERSRNDKHIAKSLLDISRVTIENKDDMPSNQAAVKDDLQQALSVFKKYGDKNMSGQVMLLQAQLYNDVKYVLSAGKEFIESRPYPNEAGYVECCNQLKRFMDHKNHEILEFLLKGADCLFNVCKTFVLKSSSSNIGASLEANFQSYCQFYGIVQQGRTSLVTFPATKPLCVKMIQHNFKSSSHEVSDLEPERSINSIVYYLLRESKPWLNFVKTALIKQRVSLQKCRSFALGKDCTCNNVDTESGNMMHAEHTATTFKQLIKTDLRLIEYEAYCYKADDILKSCTSKHSKGIKNLLSDMKAEEICIQADERYVACRFLWKDFLPESGHPGFLAEDSGQFIKPVRTNTVVLAHMKHYLLNCWNESTHGNRKIECRAAIETEIFLLFEFAYRLFHFETGKVRFERTPKQEMISFENALDNELLNGRNTTDFLKQEKKYTLMLSFVETQNTPDRRIFITCVAHRFTDAYGHLTKGDPYAAILSFAKFQTQLSQRKLQDRSIACFYPEIHHYLLWLEFYSTLAFFLIAKAKTQVDTEFTFIIPNNYIALLHFIQTTFPKGSQSIYESISRKKMHQKLEDVLLDRVKRFAFVISGHAQRAKIPEIILKKCQEDNKNSVLLERLIILNMTMLCNVGKSVPVECETSLVNSINKTFSSPSIPPRLMKVHDKVKEFKGIRDVANFLKTFLNCRNVSELLHAVKWTPHCKEKCTVLELDINLLPSAFLKQKSTARMVETQESVEDIPQDADLTQEEVLRTLVEKHQLYVTESKTLKKQTTDIDSASPYDDILDFVWIDDNECRACGFGFESNLLLVTKSTGKELETGENQIFRQSKDSDSTVDPMQRQDSQIENDTFKQMLTKAKHEHENDPMHIQNIEHLESFKRSYETHLKPLINRVYDFLHNEKYNLFDETYISKHYKDYKDEIQRLKRNHFRIENELKEKVYNRKWPEKQKYVNQIADELKNDLDLINAYVEEQTKKIGIQNSLGAAGIEASAASNEDKGTEENDFEKVVPEPRKLRRRNRTAKERGESRKLRLKNKNKDRHEYDV
ncbi:TPR and ankyrin repeat-containing protein 1-like [Mercenaria mercenaria]|uniref:TPR and ankyrin repeat-containing protein 1-like n=1 Tax=Mercenaria mercenaria TaxID=6596 RepID=UPI00234EEDFF|nr:TPR and ankyrin repeat-containing protein 1-like [Mercenaria mercenaria]